MAEAVAAAAAAAAETEKEKEEKEKDKEEEEEEEKDEGEEEKGETKGEEPLMCMALDDMSMFRKIDTTIFRKLGAADSNIVVHGETRAEQEGFLALMLERRPHVVILDQSIDLPGGGPHLRGTDLAVELARAGDARCVVCILTGGTDKEVEEIRGMPEVDLAFSKGHSVPAILAALRQTLEAKGLGGP